MPNPVDDDADDDDIGKRQPATSEGSSTARFFPDIPRNLHPRSLNGGEFDADETQQAQQALALIGSKMTAITLEYADGHINQAQFQAIYLRYCEQRVIIERILDKDPQSTAWQAITEAGSTTLLRRRYAAHADGMLLIEIRNGETIRSLGVFDLATDLLVPILSTLIERSVRPFDEGAKSTLLEGGRWLTFIPGELTASIVIFSQEPAGQQLRSLVDFHRDFECANQAALRAGKSDPARLVYPQEALFQ